MSTRYDVVALIELKAVKELNERMESMNFTDQQKKLVLDFYELGFVEEDENEDLVYLSYNCINFNLGYRKESDLYLLFKVLLKEHEYKLGALYLEEIGMDVDFYGTLETEIDIYPEYSISLNIG